MADSEIEHSSSDDSGEDYESEFSSNDEGEFEPSWSTNTAGLRQIPFTGENKLTCQKPPENRPVDWLWFVFDVILIEKILEFTNKYARDLFSAHNLEPKSRMNNWKDLTIKEFKTFIGIVLHMGTVRLNRIKDYWKTHYLFDFKAFRNVMSRDRFLLILRCLHFNDNSKENTSKLDKVQLLIDAFNNTMSQIYYPGKDLSFLSKKHKYGIKVYALTELDGLVTNFTIYSGQGGPLSGNGHAGKVVKYLMQGKLNRGHSLFIDSYYNSPKLAWELLQKGTYCTGTLRKDRKSIPVDFKNITLRTGEKTDRYAGGVMLGKWRDKRVIYYISTEFENDMGEVYNKCGELKQKPIPIIQYNAKMKGVDHDDQLLAYYPNEHKSVRWYKKVFIYLLQMMITNSYRLFLFSNPDIKIPLYDFRLKIIEQLMPQKCVTPSTGLKKPRLVKHVISKMPLTAGGKSRGRRCRVCSSEGKRKESMYFCSGCPEKPALCVVGCFDKFHNG